MAQLVDRELTHAERVDAFRSAISQIRTAGLGLIDVELFGASDEVGRCVFQLERQFRVFQDDGQRASAGNHSSLSVLAESRRRGGRRGLGVNVDPGAVRRARLAAGLTMQALAEGRMTRAAICMIEKGKARPSLETLRLIAERTGRPVSFFTVDGSE